MTFKEYVAEISEENLILESFLDEMANLPSADTGIPYFIWIGEVDGQHGPRIKVSNTKGKMNSSSCFVMSITKPPVLLTPKSCKLKQSEVDDISDWIIVNYETLMQMWKVYETGEGSIISLQLKLKKI